MCRFNILGTAVNAHTYVLTDLDILILSGFALNDYPTITVIFDRTRPVLYTIAI